MIAAALPAVQVGSADLGDQTLRESVQLVGEDDIDQEWGAIGQLARDEALTLRAVVSVIKPGAGETVIRSARDRAVELLNTIEDAFTGTGGDPTAGGTVKWAKVRPVMLHEIASDQGRVALLFFEIHSGLTRLVRS